MRIPHLGILFQCFFTFWCLCEVFTSFTLLPIVNRQHVYSKLRLNTVNDNKASIGWFDEATIFVRGGSGGHGSSSHKFGKARQHVYPTGGSGGNGGSIIFQVDRNLNTLQKFRSLTNFRAENGADGDINFRNGPAGADVLVSVPIGTIVKDNSTDVVLGTLNSPGDRLVVAAGGLGGRGNGAKGAKGEKVPASPPQGGEKRWVRLELQLIADVGLLGAPNAGKSTLLSALTNAKPKIADYAFTTLVPNLGVCYLQSHLGREHSGLSTDAMVIADIPGLVEGAHRGLGLGRAFLRHVQRCEVLIHVLDCSQPDPAAVYSAVNRELALYSKELASKPQVVVLNQIDRLSPSQLTTVRESVRAVLAHSRLLCISAARYASLKAENGDGLVYVDDDSGVRDVVKKVWSFLDKVRADQRRARELFEMNEAAKAQSQGLLLIEEEEEDSLS